MQVVVLPGGHKSHGWDFPKPYGLYKLVTCTLMIGKPTQTSLKECAMHTFLNIAKWIGLVLAAIVALVLLALGSVTLWNMVKMSRDKKAASVKAANKDHAA
jgi:hypothetical protein